VRVIVSVCVRSNEIKSVSVQPSAGDAPLPLFHVRAALRRVFAESWQTAERLIKSEEIAERRRLMAEQ
jgi:hypothetical protein